MSLKIAIRNIIATAGLHPNAAMNGAKSLVETLLKSGIDTCFANPGTSDALRRRAGPERRHALPCAGLAENAVTGIADGYHYQRKPCGHAVALRAGALRMGLQTRNNARQAHSGIVNIVGDQATYHRRLMRR